MRANLSVAAAVALLVGAVHLPSAAAEDDGWFPITVEGLDLEVRLPVGPNGERTFRMPPGRLDETLARLGERVTRLSGDLAGQNLPADLLAAPDRLFGEVADAARAMGPDLVFSNPPGLRDPVATFSFNDGKRLVSFAVVDPSDDNIVPRVEVTYRKRVAGDWKIERQQLLLVSNKKPAELAEERSAGRALFGAFGSPWVSASYWETRGTARRPITTLSYIAMERPDMWIGSEQRQGQGRRRVLLRSLDRRTGRALTAPVATGDADRLFELANRKFSVPLPASHPEFIAGEVTRRDLSTVALAEAGLEVVADRRGRAYLRRARGAVDRGALRKLGVTYVRATSRAKAHLRHLPTRQPRARR